MRATRLRYPAHDYQAAVLASGPVGYWRLGEASVAVAADVMGANPGTYVNAPTLGAAGLLTGDSDTAVTFTAASSECVDVADAAALRLGTAWTLAAWINVPSAVNRRTIMSKRNGNEAAYEFYVAANHRLQAYISDGATNGTPTSTADVDNGPHFVAVTRSGTSATLYIDGVGETPVSHGVVGSTNAVGFPLVLGTYANHGGDFFNGTLDEPAIWDRALSADEVAALYAAGMGR